MTRPVAEMVKSVIDILQRAYNRSEVVLLQYVVLVRYPNRPGFASPQTRNLDGAAEFGGNLSYRRAVVSFDSHIEMSDGGRLIWIVISFPQSEIGRSYHSNHTEKICHRVPNRCQWLIARGLTRSRQSGCIRYASREGPRNKGSIHVKYISS